LSPFGHLAQHSQILRPSFKDETSTQLPEDNAATFCVDRRVIKHSTLAACAFVMCLLINHARGDSSTVGTTSAKISRRNASHQLLITASRPQ